MTYMISTEGFQLDPALRESAQQLSEKFHEKLDIKERIRMNLTRSDKRHVVATVNLHAFQHDFVGQGKDEDALKALKAAMEALTRQALSHRKKMIDRSHHAPSAAEFVRS